MVSAIQAEAIATITGVQIIFTICISVNVRDFMRSEFSSYVVSAYNKLCPKVADCLAKYGESMLSRLRCVPDTSPRICR